MKLIFKIFKNSPSIVGILFDEVGIAQQSYRNLLNDFSNKSCSIEIEINNASINLKLKTESKSVPYPNLEYDIIRLDEFTAEIKNNDPFTFGHFIEQDSKEIAVLAPTLVLQSYSIVDRRSQ